MERMRNQQNSVTKNPGIWEKVVNYGVMMITFDCGRVTCSVVQTVNFSVVQAVTFSVLETVTCDGKKNVCERSSLTRG